jgi:polar amino acid transport system substrate-binding protein
MGGTRPAHARVAPVRIESSGRFFYRESEETTLPASTDAKGPQRTRKSRALAWAPVAEPIPRASLVLSFDRRLPSRAYNHRMHLSRSFFYFVLACLPAVAADLAPTGTLRATFLNGNPVQGTVDPKTAAISGPVADLVKELARRAGVPYTITPSNGARDLIERLNNHTFDIGLLAYEAGRARQVDYAGPYLLMGSTYLLPSASPIQTAADADRSGVKIAAVAGNAPTIYLQQHLKNATVIPWKAAPPYEEIIKMFANGSIDAYAGNRTRLTEAAAHYPGLRVAQDNFTVLEQNLVVARGDSAKLKIVDAFLNEARSTTFLKDMLVRAKLVGVEAPPPDYVAHH